jgi:DNA-directed RNA polymerase subunit RPC12/RpoP
VTEQTAAATGHFPCPGCGSRVEYAPGTTVLRCPYCGYEQAVAAVDTVIEEHSYDAWAAVPRKPVAQVGRYVFHCQGCGAQTETNDLSDRCQFCSAPIVANPTAVELIAPEAVVPFQVRRDQCREAFHKWVTSRWFAPSSLKKVGATEQLTGTYLPHWTYDSSTTTEYTGQRGEHYYVTETYTVTVDGRAETRTWQVQKTRWYPTRGTVARNFDDVLVPASTALPHDRLGKLGPWQLHQAVPFQPDYLSGYRTLRYDTDPDTGLQVAKQEMQRVIQDDCRHDIGGDEQIVNSMDTRYAALMFKLILLPMWIAAYLHAGKSWQVVVNANTGEVVGARPYSALKIAAAVVAAIILIVTILLVAQAVRH